MTFAPNRTSLPHPHLRETAMRLAIATLILVFAAACSKQSDDAAKTEAAPVAASEASEAAPIVAAVDPWPANFPKPTVDYAGVYDFSAGGAAMEVKIAASGVRQRLDFPPGAGVGGAGGQWSQAMVNENAGEKLLMWPEGDGAPAIATMMSRKDLGAMASAFGVDADRQASAKRTGTDNIAGLDCAVWEFAVGDGETPGEACVTRDGIPLRVVSGGQTVMLAKSIERGPQDASRFAPPAGYEIVDMGECMRMGAEMMEAMRAGKTPDMAKMEKCRALGEKMGQMYGQ